MLCDESGPPSSHSPSPLYQHVAPQKLHVPGGHDGGDGGGGAEGGQLSMSQDVTPVAGYTVVPARPAWSTGATNRKLMMSTVPSSSGAMRARNTTLSVFSSCTRAHTAA